MATHSSILAWGIPRTEEPGGFSPCGCKELDTTERLSIHTRKKRVTFPIPRKEQVIFYFDVQKIGGKKKMLQPEFPKPTIRIGYDNTLFRQKFMQNSLNFGTFIIIYYLQEL